jgi:hypothetical protein
MSEKTFKKWMEDPSTLTHDEIRGVLLWRDENPAEASRLLLRREESRREEYDKAALRDAWLARGGDPADFDQQYPNLRKEHQASRLRELDGSARGASMDRVRSNF